MIDDNGRSVAGQPAIVAIPAIVSGAACETCRFWLEVEGSGSLSRRRAIGQCRRKPPVLVGAPETLADALVCTVFPETLSDDWCGEHRPAKEPIGI